ncbi:scarecrow-like protein 13 [Tripterygium wilfordii]|uniref:scarecrow-like protein 13 n=1 Tax=Tripterygium wilfordii TaxID=458696 RepID=UPI0018F8366D|nr:scarecrow-like protein 13 [Tripterygium wilfordii]
MQTSQTHQTAAAIHGFYHQPMQEIEPYDFLHFKILDNNGFGDVGCDRTSVSFQECEEQFFTLESATASTGFVVYDSPSATSTSTSRSSHSYLSDPHHSPDNAYSSPVSGSSITDNDNVLRHKLRELEISLLGPESDNDSCNCCSMNGVHQAPSVSGWDWNQLVQMLPRLDLKQVLIACARAVCDGNMPTAAGLMHVLEQKVSVSGEPIQRLGAYMLEGLRARLASSGSKIYKSLKCEEPTSSELLSYMTIIFQICPYWRFAYKSANAVIQEAIENEPRIHIIDFQIAQGSQWMGLIQALADQPGGASSIRITGIDDSQSNHARGGGLHIVGQRLKKLAKSCNLQFEFHDAAMSGCEVQLEDLMVRPGEAVVVNFPYVLHHVPDESVTTWNHRDRLLRLVKSLSPKVVTLMEQESNTNTSPFFQRFVETLDYYHAFFESIDVACPRDDKQRINAEQHCVARDIVNMVACEGAERVERHELLGKWRSRLMMAGFTPYPLASSGTSGIRDLLKEYNKNYGLEERDGALYLLWKNRAMATSSAWR